MTTTTPGGEPGRSGSVSGAAQAALAVASFELNSDLDALGSLPEETLNALIDPGAPRAPPPKDAKTQLAAYDPATSDADAALALSRAYAAEMREKAAHLRAEEIGVDHAAGGTGSPQSLAPGGAAADLARLESIRTAAEKVLEAVDEYDRARTSA